MMLYLHTITKLKVESGAPTTKAISQVIYYDVIENRSS